MRKARRGNFGALAGSPTVGSSVDVAEVVGVGDL
jgi:hypothetical protein